MAGSGERGEGVETVTSQEPSGSVGLLVKQERKLDNKVGSLLCSVHVCLVINWYDLYIHFSASYVIMNFFT